MSNQIATDTKELQKKLLCAIKELKASDTKALVMPALQTAQEIYGYLAKEAMLLLSQELGESLEKLYGIATFYSQFSLTAVGKYKIGVCLGTACYVKGSGDVVEKFEEVLQIKRGETTSDGRFTLEATRCVGCCGLAPVITVNEDVYGKATVADVSKILEIYNKE